MTFTRLEQSREILGKAMNSREDKTDNIFKDYNQIRNCVTHVIPYKSNRHGRAMKKPDTFSDDTTFYLLSNGPILGFCKTRTQHLMHTSLESALPLSDTLTPSALFLST